MIKKALTAMFGVFRERVLSIPGKTADACEMRTRDEIEQIIREELYEALEELSDPPTVATGSRVVAETG